MKKIPAVQVLKPKAMFCNAYVKIGGVEVGSLAYHMRTGSYHIRISLITDQYTTHAMSDPCFKGERSEAKAIIEKWLREYVFTPDSKCKKVQPWHGWEGPWIKGPPMTHGKFFLVFSDDHQSISLIEIDHENEVEYVEGVLAHAPVTIPASPFKSVNFK